MNVKGFFDKLALIVNGIERIFDVLFDKLKKFLIRLYVKVIPDSFEELGKKREVRKKGLIPCKECGNEVSTKAKACPKCGAIVNDPITSFARGVQSSLVWGVRLSVILVILLYILGYFASFGGSEQPTITTPKTTVAPTTPPITKDLAQIILSTSDLPSDFKLVRYNSSEEVISVEYQMGGNLTEFLRNNPTHVGVLQIINVVGRLNSISEAQRAFNDNDKKFYDNFQMKLATDVIGEETSLYFNRTGVLGSRQLNVYVLLFREKNIVSTVFLGGLDTNMSEVIKYARVVEGKIGETPTPGKPITTMAPPTKAPTIQIHQLTIYDLNDLQRDIQRTCGTQEVLAQDLTTELRVSFYMDTQIPKLPEAIRTKIKCTLEESIKRASKDPDIDTVIIGAGSWNPYIFLGSGAWYKDGNYTDIRLAYE